MMRIVVTTLLLMCGASLAATPVAKSPPAAKPSAKPDEPLPTQAEIQKTFEAGDYQQTLLQLGRVLPLKGTAAKDYNRYDLFMLKGETHLHLKQLKSAGDAFAAAAKETKDDTDAAKARATQYVLREAKGLTVVRKSSRKGEKVQSADLLDPAQREDAFRIVFDDLRAAVEPKVKEALHARTLPPISDAIKSLSELHDLEVASGGDSSLTSTKQDLAERARKLMAKELDRMQKDVTAIFNNANTVVKETYGTPTGTSRSVGTAGVTSTTTGGEDYQVYSVRRGLTDRDRADLKSAISTCEKIISTTESLARATDVANIDDIIDQAKDVGRSAERVLRARY